MNGYYKTVIEIITRHGGYFVRNAAGDHEIWRCGNKQTTIDRGTRSRHSANAYLKQLCINEKI